MKRAFEHFHDRLGYADWEKPQDILDSFGNSDLVTCRGGRSRIAFNVGRNRYRMVCGYNFTSNQAILYVKFVGTHSDYDKIKVCEIDMFKSKT